MSKQTKKYAIDAVTLPATDPKSFWNTPAGKARRALMRKQNRENGSLVSSKTKVVTQKAIPASRAPNEHEPSIDWDFPWNLDGAPMSPDQQALLRRMGVDARNGRFDLVGASIAIRRCLRAGYKPAPAETEVVTAKATPAPRIVRNSLPNGNVTLQLNNIPSSLADGIALLLPHGCPMCGSETMCDC